MTEDEYAAMIRANVPRRFWDETLGQVEFLFQAAHRLAAGTGLIARRASHVEGQYRFVAIEQAFETVGARNGGINLYRSPAPGTDQVLWQPYQQFGKIVVGFAMQPEPGALPPRNRSRLGAVQLNLPFEPRLPFPEEPEADRMFVALCASRDREHAGSVRGIELLVIDSRYDQILFRQPLARFLAGYGEPSAPAALAPEPAPRRSTPPAPPQRKAEKAPTDRTDARPPPQGKPLVRLRSQPKPIATLPKAGKKTD